MRKPKPMPPAMPVDVFAVLTRPDGECLLVAGGDTTCKRRGPMVVVIAGRMARDEWLQGSALPIGTASVRVLSGKSEADAVAADWAAERRIVGALLDQPTKRMRGPV